MIDDCVQGVGISPVRQISLQILLRMSVTVSPPCFVSSAGMLSIPAALPLFSTSILTLLLGAESGGHRHSLISGK